MRVLFASYGEKTHFIGMIPMVWAARAAGHEVLFASQPQMADFAAGAGLPFAAVGRDHMLHALSMWSLGQGNAQASAFFDVGDSWPRDIPWQDFQLGMEESVRWWWSTINNPMLDDLVDLCRDWRPDLVVWEPTTFAAAIAAEACQAVHLRFVWTLDMAGRMREDFLAAMEGRTVPEGADALATWLARHAERHGVEFSERLVQGYASIDHFPASLGLETGPHIERLPVRYLPYNGRAVVPDWVRTDPPERPRVCVCMGSSAAEWYGWYGISMAEVLAALGEQDVEVVATLPASQQRELGTVPDNVRLVEFVPLHAVAPTCAAVLNHGGPSTVGTAAAFGVPQLFYTVPDLDAPLLARKVADAGAGIVLDPARPVPEEVAAALHRLATDPGIVEGSLRLRDSILEMPAPATVAAGLTELTERLREEAVPTAGAH